MGILANLKKKFKDFFSKTKLSISNNKKKITIGGTLSAGALATLLSALAIYGILFSVSEDIYCSTCISYFNISISDYSLCFDKTFNLYFDDVSKLSSLQINKLINDEWVPTNLTKTCLVKGLHQYQIIGIKKNPSDTIKWGLSGFGKDLDPYWYGTSNSHTFVDGTIGCENATFEINNTDKSLQFGFNYKSAILNKMTPFIFLENGDKHYIKDLLPTYDNRFNFSIDEISCGKWKFGLNLSIPQTVNVDYIGFSYENIIGNPNIELDEEEHTVRINNGEAEMIIEWSDIANRVFLNKTSKEVLINITGIKNINIDPTVTFNTGAVEAQSIAPLTNNTFVLAYCDDTNDDISFIIFDTNGTNLTGINGNAIDADNAIGSCWGQSVSVSAFNSTHFVIGFNDNADKDVTFVIANTSGSILTTVDVDSNFEDASESLGGVSVSAFNSTYFVIGWIDFYVSDNDTTTAVYNITGSLVAGPTDVDTNIGTTSTSAGVELGVSALNSTLYVVTWYDNPDLDVTFSVYDSGNIIISGPTDVDTGAGTAELATVTALNSTHFAIIYNTGSTELKLRAYNISSSALFDSVTVDSIISDTNGATISISVLNSTDYVLSWGNSGIGTNFSSYNISGNKTWGSGVGTSTGDEWSAISSKEAGTGQSFCVQNFILSFTASTTVANWTAYQSNGTVWDGTCPIGDTTPPTYSLNSTNSTTAGTPIEFRLNWTDNVGLSKAITSLWNGSSWVNASAWCSLSGTSSWCNQTLVVNSTPQTLWWKQYANDTSNNWNTSENFSLVTTSAGAPDIEMSFGPPSTTMVMFNQPQICDEEQTYSFIYPENQTSTLGIFNLTNNGTATATDFRCSVTNNAPTGYALMVGNTSGNYSIPDATNVSIYFNIIVDDIKQLWLYLNCTYPEGSWHPNFACYAT